MGHRGKPEVVHGESQERVAVRAGLLAEAGVVSTADRERFARIALSFVAEPGDPALGSLLNGCGPAEAFSAICDGHPPPMAGSARIPGLGRAIERWAARLDRVPTDSKLAAWERAGIRVLIPGDPEWPPQADTLGESRPLVLWLRGGADLRFACLRSVSVVGARAATGLRPACRHRDGRGPGRAGLGGDLRRRLRHRQPAHTAGR